MSIFNIGGTLILILIFGFIQPCFDARSDKMIDGFLARSEEIKSGRISYQFSDMNSNTSNFDAVFSGTSWRIDVPAFQITRINHGGNLVEFKQTLQPDLSTTNSARYESPKPIETQNPQPPFFGGTTWYRSTKDYISSHKAAMKFVGITLIDDEPCATFELRVPAEDRFAAFHSITNSLNDGGILRLHISERFGYATPRIEYLTPQGDAALLFESKDFAETGRGLWFPKKTTRTSFEINQKGTVIGSYVIERITEVNEPIPDKDFLLVLPPGTKVSGGK